MESGWQFSKNLVTAAHGIVAAKHPLAARAGLRILQQGGNAVDAAVATAFAVGVVEPWASGLGGAGVLIVSSPNSAPVAVDYGVRAPAAARADMFPLGPGIDQETGWWRSVSNDANIHGPLSVAVPGVPRGLAAALARFGTMPLAEVLRPAIALARDGFPIHWTTVMQIALDAPLLQRYDAAAKIFLPDGVPPMVSSPASPQRLRQPELARTLEAIASEGPDAFYCGPVARLMVDAIQRGGGVLTGDDLAEFQPVIEPAWVCHTPDYQVAVAPGPHSGVTLAEMFDILGGLDLESRGHNTTDYLHWLIEATHAALGDRLARFGEEVGWGLPTSRTRTAAHRRRISNDHATPWDIHVPDASGTTHLCVVDGTGTAVSLTQTLLSWFGSRMLVPGTGVVLNNGMMWFDPVPGRANSIGPGRRPLSNMTPAVVFSEGGPVLAVGASGGRRILDGVCQVILNCMSFAMDVQSAIAAPRIDASGPQVMVDQRIPAGARDGLRQRGHPLVCVDEDMLPRLFSSPVAIARHAADGLLHGGADPYHPAIAAGY